MFLESSRLLWGLLLVPLILYLVRPRPQTATVTTLPFFRELARTHAEPKWLRWLKRFVSLLLSLAIIAQCVLALADWVGPPLPNETNHVVLLLDISASMAARQDDGPTRLAEALTEARSRLTRLKDHVALTLIAYDRRPQVLVSATRNHREVLASLEQLRVRPIAGETHSAIALALQLAGPHRPAEIWHFSDHPADDTTRFEAPEHGSDGWEQITLRNIDVSLSEATNVGVTAFELRRAPLLPDRYEAFVQVQAALPAAHSSAVPRTVNAELQVTLDDELVTVRQLTLRHAEPVDLRFTVPADKSTTMQLAIQTMSASGDSTARDNLSLDNLVLARVPAMQPIRVLWLTDNETPFTRLALQSLATEGHVAVKAGQPQWPVAESADLVIFSGWLPETWPERLPVLVIDPPDYANGPLQSTSIADIAMASTSIEVVNADHPILYGIPSEQVRPRRTALLQLHGALQPLWLDQSGPLLAAGEFRGQRVCVLAADPDRSGTWPLQPAFPLLLANAIYWTARDALQDVTGNNRRTGDRIILNAVEDNVHDVTVRWQTPAAGEAARSLASETRRLPGSTHHVELDQQGLWQITDGTRTRRGAAALLSAEETCLGRSPTDDTFDARGALASRDRSTWQMAFPEHDPTTTLLGLCVILLVLENWLFHRLGVE